MNSIMHIQYSYAIMHTLYTYDFNAVCQQCVCEFMLTIGDSSCFLSILSCLLEKSLPPPAHLTTDPILSPLFYDLDFLNHHCQIFHLSLLPPSPTTHHK